MEVINRDNLLEHATRVGNHLIAEAKKLAERQPLIGDVRGVGLFLGIELVKDRVTREPATDAARYVVHRMKEEKIIVSSEGPDYNILKLKPPMVFSIENANQFIAKLDELLQEFEINNNEKKVIKIFILKFLWSRHRAARFM